MLINVKTLSKVKTTMREQLWARISIFFNKGTVFTENFTHTLSFYHQHRDHPNYIATFGLERSWVPAFL